MKPLLFVIEEMAAATREALGEERLAWLTELPRASQMQGPVALVHASPDSPWRCPMPEASDAELEAVYRPLGQAIAVHAHIHRSYIRRVAGMVVANSGSVSLSYDGDRRAAYFLLDGGQPSIRRVEYDVDNEIKALAGCAFSSFRLDCEDSGERQLLGAIARARVLPAPHNQRNGYSVSN